MTTVEIQYFSHGSAHWGLIVVFVIDSVEHRFVISEPYLLPWSSLENITTYRGRIPGHGQAQLDQAALDCETAGASLSTDMAYHPQDVLSIENRNGVVVAIFAPGVGNPSKMVICRANTIEPGIRRVVRHLRAAGYKVLSDISL